MSSISLRSLLFIPLHRAIEDQAEIWNMIKEHMQAELTMHAAAGRLFTHARDIDLTLHS